MSEIYNDNENSETLNGSTEETQDNQAPKAPLNKAALVAGILNIVSGLTYILFAVLFFAGITSFNADNLPDSEKAGIVLVFIFIIPMLLVTVFPTGVAGGIWGIARAVISFLQIRGERKSRIWVLILGIVFKVLIGAVSGFGLILFISLNKSINPLLFYPEVVIGILAIGTSLAVIPFEFVARK